MGTTGLARGFLLCLFAAGVGAGCSSSTGSGLRTLTGSPARSSTPTQASVSIPTPVPDTGTSPPPTNMPFSLQPGTLVLTNPTQKVTFSPGITSSHSYGGGSLILTPAPKSKHPAIPWQTVAGMCRTSVGCYELSPVAITLALATGAFNRSPNAQVAPTFDNTFVYVISQQVPCLSLSFPGGSATASTLAPGSTCALVNLMNARTGYFYGGTQWAN